MVIVMERENPERRAEKQGVAADKAVVAGWPLWYKTRRLTANRRQAGKTLDCAG
jgi:hypothetical protein